jgi:enamine deaminase RidA (YjgF/YER057c/UK114 family)
MTRRLISSGSVLEAKVGYSRAVVDGDLVFVSGCTGLDYATDTLAEGASEQTRQTFVNIQWALEQAGCTLKDVVRATLLVTDRADVPEILEVVGAHFRDIRPASTLMICGLVRPEMKIEIEVTARLPHRPA